MAEKTLEIGGDVVTIRKFKWGAYTEVRDLISQTLAGPIVGIVFSLLQGPTAAFFAKMFESSKESQPDASQSLEDYAKRVVDSATTENRSFDLKEGLVNAIPLFRGAIDQVKQELPRLLTEATSFTAQYESLLLKHAVEFAPGMSPGSMCWEDVAQIVAVAYELNNPAAILEREKNLLSAVVQSGCRVFNVQTQSLGTSTPNPK